MSKLQTLKYSLRPTNKEEALFFGQVFSYLIILQNKNKIFQLNYFFKDSNQQLLSHELPCSCVK